MIKMRFKFGALCVGLFVAICEASSLRRAITLTDAAPSSALSPAGTDATLALKTLQNAAFLPPQESTPSGSADPVNAASSTNDPDYTDQDSGDVSIIDQITAEISSAAIDLPDPEMAAESAVVTEDAPQDSSDYAPELKAALEEPAAEVPEGVETDLPSVMPSTRLQAAISFHEGVFGASGPTDAAGAEGNVDEIPSASSGASESKGEDKEGGKDNRGEDSEGGEVYDEEEYKYGVEEEGRQGGSASAPTAATGDAAETDAEAAAFAAGAAAAEAAGGDQTAIGGGIADDDAAAADDAYEGNDDDDDDEYEYEDDDEYEDGDDDEGDAEEEKEAVAAEDVEEEKEDATGDPMAAEESLAKLFMDAEDGLTSVDNAESADHVVSTAVDEAWESTDEGGKGGREPKLPSLRAKKKKKLRQLFPADYEPAEELKKVIETAHSAADTKHKIRKQAVMDKYQAEASSKQGAAMESPDAPAPAPADDDKDTAEAVTDAPAPVSIPKAARLAAEAAATDEGEDTAEGATGPEGATGATGPASVSRKATAEDEAMAGFA